MQQRLYEKARAGELQGITGVDAPYQPPERPEVRIPTAELGVEQAVDRILAALG